MNKRLLVFLLIFVTLVVAGLIYYMSVSTVKIGYVRTLELVYSFNGMKQAHVDYKSREEAWQSNIDTLHARFRQAVARYEENAKKMSVKEREEQEQQLRRQEEELNNYVSVIGNEAKDQEQQLTNAVLAQINSFIEDYGKKNGYDIILGAEGSGSLLYGGQAFDITDDVLKALNASYKLLPAPSAGAPQATPAR